MSNFILALLFALNLLCIVYEVYDYQPMLAIASFGMCLFIAYALFVRWEA